MTTGARLSLSTPVPRKELASLRFTRGISRNDVLEATAALASLHGAGLTLPKALAAVRTVTPDAMARVLGDVRQRIEGGEPLHIALGAHPTVFSPVYIGMVRAGERSGRLAEGLNGLATLLERQAALRAELSAALLYPLVLAAAGSVSIGLLTFVVLPRFAAMLQDVGAQLPATTRLMLRWGTLAQEHYGLFLLILAGLAFAGALLQRRPAVRKAQAELVLGLPVLGDLRRNVLGARFARVTGTMLHGGAPLLSALSDATISETDPLAQYELSRLHAAIREGSGFAQTLGVGRLYPALLTHLVAVGEDSGRLADFLSKAAVVLEERADRARRRLVSLAEPLMIVLFGSVVGFVALSLLQAVYSINAGALQT